MDNVSQFFYIDILKDLVRQKTKMVRLLFQIELNRFETNAIVTQKFSFVRTRGIRKVQQTA